MQKLLAIMCISPISLLFGRGFFDSTTFFESSYLRNEEGILIQHEYEEDDHKVIAIDTEKVIPSPSAVFEFEANTNISSVTCEAGDNLVGYEIDGEKISCLLSDFKDSSFSTLSFYSDNEIIFKKTLYFAKDSSGIVHSSSLSLDAAKRYAGQELDYELVQEEKTETLLNSGATKISILKPSGNVSGTLKWTDEDAGVHPLIGAIVEASAGGLSIQTITDEKGYYEIGYNNIWQTSSGNISIYVYAKGENVSVMGTDGGIYCYTYETNAKRTSLSFSKTFSPTEGDLGKAMMVFQGAYNFSEQAKILNDGSAISFCSFRYPGIAGESSYYSNGVVNVSSNERFNDGYPSYFAAWDVLGHEYGHHIQQYFDLNSSPGGGHGSPENTIDYKILEEDDSGKLKYSIEQAKEYGLRLAWGEAWPTYWSTVAQSHFSDDLKTIYTVGDTVYTSPHGLYVVDAYEKCYGDADEIAIQRVLYKLYSSETDDFDKFSLGEEKMWEIIKSSKKNSFSDFMTELYSLGYNKNDLGLLLGKFNIICSSLIISDNFLDTRPTFSWSAYMGSNYFYYNSFDLYFLDQNGNELTKRTNIPNLGDSSHFTIAYSRWAIINSADGDTFNVYIVARNDQYYKNGDYYSKLFSFEKPTTFSASKLQVKPSEWEFDNEYYSQNKTTIFENGALTITTNRLGCAYVENSYVCLSPRKAGGGSASFRMDFSQPVYSVLYSACLWSENEELDGEALVSYLNSNGEWIQTEDLLNDVSLPVIGDGIYRNSIYDMNGIYGLKYEVSAAAAGNVDKGRLCVDDIVLGIINDSSLQTYAVRGYPKTIA